MGYFSILVVESASVFSAFDPEEEDAEADSEGDSGASYGAAPSRNAATSSDTAFFFSKAFFRLRLRDDDDGGLLLLLPSPFSSLSSFNGCASLNKSTFFLASAMIFASTLEMSGLFLAEPEEPLEEEEEELFEDALAAACLPRLVNRPVAAFASPSSSSMLSLSPSLFILLSSSLSSSSLLLLFEAVSSLLLLPLAVALALLLPFEAVVVAVEVLFRASLFAPLLLRLLLPRSLGMN